MISRAGRRRAVVNVPVMVTTAALPAPALPFRAAPARRLAAFGADTAAVRSTDVIRALNAEWTQVLRQAGSAATTRTWAGREGALACAQTLSDVERLAGGPDGDDVLVALLSLAQDGDQLAARTVLQLQLGAVVRLALRTCHYAGGDLQEAKARAVSCLWEAIAAYPLPRRRGNHAGSLALDVLNRLTSHADNRPGRAVRQAELLEVPQEDLLQSLADRPEPTGDADPAREVLDLLSWAVRRHVLTADDADLLRQLHTSASARELTQAAMARQLGISHAALRQRSSRATRRLADAVRCDRRLSAPVQPARAVDAA